MYATKRRKGDGSYEDPLEQSSLQSARCVPLGHRLGRNPDAHSTHVSPVGMVVQDLSNEPSLGHTWHCELLPYVRRA